MMCGVCRAGDVIYIHIFGNPIVVLNSAEAVNDLFEKRSAIYSSRPVRTMINDLYAFFDASPFPIVTAGTLQNRVRLAVLVDAVWYFMEEAPQSFSPALQYNQPTVRSARGPA